MPWIIHPAQQDIPLKQNAIVTGIPVTTSIRHRYPSHHIHPCPEYILALNTSCSTRCPFETEHHCHWYYMTIARISTSLILIPDYSQSLDYSLKIHLLSLLNTILSRSMPTNAIITSMSNCAVCLYWYPLPVTTSIHALKTSCSTTITAVWAMITRTGYSYWYLITPSTHPSVPWIHPLFHAQHCFHKASRPNDTSLWNRTPSWPVQAIVVLVTCTDTRLLLVTWLLPQCIHPCPEYNRYSMPNMVLARFSQGIHAQRHVPLKLNMSLWNGAYSMPHQHIHLMLLVQLLVLILPLATLHFSQTIHQHLCLKSINLSPNSSPINTSPINPLYIRSGPQLLNRYLPQILNRYLNTSALPQCVTLKTYGKVSCLQSLYWTLN